MARRAVATLVLLAAPLTGCGLVDRSGADQSGRIIDAATTTPSADPTPSPAGTAAGPLPKSCDALVSYAAVLDALAVPLEGDSRYVFAGPIAQARRTGRITCTYGIVIGPDGLPRPPRLEVTVNAYEDRAAATERLDLSLDDARGKGQSVESLELSGRPGYLVGDPVDVSYVIADGDRTLVVTLARGLVPEPAVTPALLGIAGAVLRLPEPTVDPTVATPAAGTPTVPGLVPTPGT